jgi:hypothetical protein
MPVRRFRSVEEMNRPQWREPGSPELVRAIAALWTAGLRLHRRRFPPGVYRHRSIEELDAQTARWSADHVRSLVTGRGRRRDVE